MAMRDAVGEGLPRVLAVIRWPVGGIRTWCKYVYRAPQFGRVAIDFIMPDGDEAAALAADLATSGAAVQVIRTGVSTRAFAAAVGSRLLSHRYSLVHSHGFTSALICAWPCKLRRVPHLVTSHDMVLPNQYTDVKGRCIRGLVDQALRTVHAIHAVSHSSRENIEASFPAARRCPFGVRVIRSGIESRTFLASRATDIRQRIRISPEAILVGFFGRFMTPKGFRYLVDAVHAHQMSGRAAPEIAVLAVGGGGFVREEQQRIKSLGLARHFQFEDFMPDIAGTLKAVDVVAMPSLWETCPLLPMETMTSGVPLVVSDCAALREIAADTPARVVPTRDSMALLGAIIEMGSPRERAIADAFAEAAAARFDVVGMRQELAEFYDELIAGR